jgi:phosphoribosylformimino-5-aminoimidazole carboxamide ribotide isomerase
MSLCVLIPILIDFIRSCRRRDDKWIVAMNKWQDLTDMEVNKGKTSAPSFISRQTAGMLSLHLCLHGGTESLDLLSQYCSELLIHAADVEGLCQGIDEELVTSKSSSLNLGQHADG